ncbi:MAG: glycoside hydrolase family 71/99-like protein [Verrucomicrobiae bacterium]|nr:glycoside hydrolase family 71/99-like protein [Verrucomicrobiae bacterium]
MKPLRIAGLVAVIAAVWFGTVSQLRAQTVSAPRPVVDASTMEHKLLLGYQGWFACPGDGSPPDCWVHWFRRNNPVATNATVDFWPDTAELDADELFPTGLQLPDGSPAKVYSAFTPKTVARHFQWMRDYGVAGVFLQRFTSELSDPAFFALRNGVAVNVRAGAEKYGRVFAIMYDVSGQRADQLQPALTNDWNYLTKKLLLTASGSYLRQHGKPVVALWGFGFARRGDTPGQALAAIHFFQAAGCTVVGGVPAHWRTLDRDAQTNAAWAEAFRAFDVISPWSVGRYVDDAGADNFAKNVIVPDLAAAKIAGCGYMPVIFPGFSWHNLNGGPVNQIPRRGGAFYWQQVYNAVKAGCPMLYGAMFDELDEGTALFKLAPTSAQLPAAGNFVALDVDGVTLPSDWYLRLTGEAGKMLRGEIPLSPQIPISP